MREIKFRIRNKETGRIWSSKDYYGMLTFCDGEICGDGWDFESQYIKEQYIGRKDKSGKEIYDGDIVKNSRGFVREVGFNERRSAFMLYSRDLEVWITNEIIDSTYEIIGNIYDSEHLTTS